MWHEEEGQKDSHGNRKAEHPRKQPGVGKAGGRCEQQIERAAKWVSNCINNEGKQ